MSIDYQQVYTRIKEIGATLQQRKKTLEERRNEARRLLRHNASDVEGLRRRVDSVKSADPSIRCAVPLIEPLDAHTRAPASLLNAVLIAADGSQINPDRHAAVQFGLINVGTIILRQDSGEAPTVITRSRLLFDEELYTRDGNPLSDGMVALERDLDERTELLEQAKLFDTATTPVITFTDGPLELWGSRDGEDARAYYESLEKYKSVLSQLQGRGVVTAGYVDKPAADLVVRLLELIEATPEQLESLRHHHPLRGVSDRWLFGDRKNPLLQPGERSAVFVLQSKSEKDYQGVLALHFFYLNVGSEGNPWPVRVEIPRWVAENRQMLDMLHATLVDQCRMMGARPFPYLLNRAHEIAVVKQEEKHQIEQLLQLELRRNGEEMDDPSNKQAGKDSLSIGRTRF